VTTNSFNNTQHVRISLINLKVSAVCTFQHCPNVIKFHEAKLRPVSEKSYSLQCRLLLVEALHQQKDEKCLRNTNILNISKILTIPAYFWLKYQSFTKFSIKWAISVVPNQGSIVPGGPRKDFGGPWPSYVQDESKIAKCQTTLCGGQACKRQIEHNSRNQGCQVQMDQKC